ncbi:MAG TPA: helicase-related protein [Candidatus Cloacimonadota bacterium]|nr:helicase-related protein [Candidatus Cloacimonadota bacterium]
MADSNLRDNYNRGCVGDFLKEKLVEGADVSIVSAYFTIYAYEQIKDKLAQVNDLKFLFGEPTFLKSVDPKKAIYRKYSIADERLVISPEDTLYQRKVAKDCAAWMKKSNVQIKSMVKPNFLHGKMYHVKEKGGVEQAIVGSSNFTVNGLGLGGSKNIELNVIVDNDRDRKDLKAWFDEIWNSDEKTVVDVKKEVLKYIEQLVKPNSPRFIYLKTLYHMFEGQLDEEVLPESSHLYDSVIWKELLHYQKDGVKGAINKINNYGGCILADSVGLGKTYEALAVIKHFELQNAKVLVLCPKKLSGNWTIYQASQNNGLNPLKDDAFRYTVLFHTDMGRESGVSSANGILLENFDWGAFDLVVIDESHNFRGNPIERDGKKNRAKWLLDKILKGGYNTKVLMLSATPVNNRLSDLTNQINLITQGNDKALSEKENIKSISQTINQADKQVKAWLEEKPIKSKHALMEKFDASFYKLLDMLTIARSRKQVKEFYEAHPRINFSKREKPVDISSQIDFVNTTLSYNDIFTLILANKLSIYNPSKYLYEDKIDVYFDEDNDYSSQDQSEFNLIGIMITNYLKRLESSINSFAISIKRTIVKIEKLEKKITKYQAKDNPSKDENIIESILPDEDEMDEIEGESDDWEVGKKLKFKLGDLKTDKWLIELRADKRAMRVLLDIAESVTPDRDAKLIRLKELISEKVNNPFNKDNKKVLIFSAFADTVNYLYENIKDWAKGELKLNIAMVTGTENMTTFGRNDYDNILTNFAPKAKKRHETNSTDKDGEIDILIATDCISEGQNLQDCDFVVNYDIHWNPVRVIQRFGRIDRLSSENETIKMVNFWPGEDIEKYLNLEERVKARSALVDATATGDDNVFDPDEDCSKIKNPRNDQLRKLKDEILDIDDLDDSLSLVDLSTEGLKLDLSGLDSNYRDYLAATPLGLYAIAPAPGGEYAALAQGRVFEQAEKSVIKPGIIFCLRQISDDKENKKQNPFSPYYLVYVREDGTVRFNYANAKQILRIYKLLCSEIEKPIEELCQIFDQETENGTKIDKQSELLKKSITDIVNLYQDKNKTSLNDSRDFILPLIENQLNESKDFELITWLIIK